MAVNVIDIIKPKNNGKFPVVEDTDIKGGFRVVDTIAERDAVPVKHKKKSMFVYVSETNIIYLWNPTTVAWDVGIDLANIGSGGGAEPFDPSPATRSTTPYLCPTGVQLGDIVRLTGPDLVDLAYGGSLATVPGFGMVSERPDANHCHIILDGEAPFFTGLTTGQIYYLSDTQPGKITPTAPFAEGTVTQKVGIARNSTTLVLLMDISDIIAH